MDALLNGPFGRVPLLSTPLTIGRLPDNHLVINDPKTSSRHAEIRPNAGIYLLTDLGSRNGTFVNEQQLAGNEPRQLNSGDVIRIGDTRFTYETSGSAQIEPTVFAGQAQEPVYAPTIVTPPVSPDSPTPVLAQDAQEQPASSTPPASSQAPASPNTAYGMGTSGIVQEENQQEYQRQPYIPYVSPNQQPPSAPTPFSQGQPAYLPPPMYRQPMQQGNPQQPMYGPPSGLPQQYPYGQPGQPGYQMLPYGTVPTAPVETQPRRKRRFAIIAAVLGAVVLLAVILGAVYFTIRSTPTKTLSTFCNDLQNGNYQDAYDQFSARVRESGTEASFESTFKAAFATRKGLSGCTVGDVNDNGTNGNGVMTWVFKDSGPSAVFKTSLLDENGTWKIDNLSQ